MLDYGDALEEFHIQGGPKKLAHFVFYANIDRFWKLFHFQNQENIFNNTVTKYAPYLKCVATLPREMSVS